jgi:hypothetical protein
MRDIRTPGTGAAGVAKSIIEKLGAPNVNFKTITSQNNCMFNMCK